MTDHRYDVLTWDPEDGRYTEQDGLCCPSVNVPWRGLLQALRELRKLGYTCHRGPTGSDPAVLVEMVNAELERVFVDAEAFR